MRILIADDDPDLIEGLRWYLEAEGYEITAALDGAAALEIFRREVRQVRELETRC